MGGNVVGQQLGALHVEDDRGAGVARQHVAGQQDRQPIAPDDLAALVDHTHAVAVAIEAEAEVPRAISSAFISGNLGILDYYRLQNIQADTQMRNQIGQDPKTRWTDSNPPIEWSFAREQFVQQNSQ